MGGAGLAAEVNNPAKPYGRMFVATGNGSYGINAPTVSGQPYSNPSNSYGMSVVDLDLTERRSYDGRGRVHALQLVRPERPERMDDLGFGRAGLAAGPDTGFGEDIEPAD